MTSNETTEAWNGLMEFLVDDAQLTDDQVLEGLRKSGVDTVAFLNRVGETIRKGIQMQRREQAKEERQRLDARLRSVRERVLHLSIDAIRKIREDAEKGAFGVAGQEMAMAFRNKTSFAPTPDALRAMAEDILMISEGEIDSDDSNPDR